MGPRRRCKPFAGRRLKREAFSVSCTPSSGELMRAGEDQLRERAVRRLKKQSEFREHPLVYLRWSASRDELGGDRLGDRGGHHAGIAYRPDEPNEERIHREMERLRSRL
jgi:hypothetical protein